MANFSVNHEFMIAKGPLSDKEELLRDLLMREAFFTGPAAAGVSQAPKGTANTPPIVAQPTGSAMQLLEPVVPGELITADYMNTIVRAVNRLIVLASRRDQAPDESSVPDRAVAVPASPGVAGLLKGVEIALADDSDEVNITFPADKAQPSDFADFMVGNQRVDPADIVKTGDKFSFKINKADYVDGAQVRAVSNGGSSAQNVLALFK